MTFECDLFLLLFDHRCMSHAQLVKCLCIGHMIFTMYLKKIVPGMTGAPRLFDWFESILTSFHIIIICKHYLDTAFILPCGLCL